MIEIKSVSKPDDAGIELAALDEQRVISNGQPGRGTAEQSRSAREYLVSGKVEKSSVESIIFEGDNRPDDRERILDTDLFPWRMICSLDIHGRGGSFVGTGWLAGPRTIITAGHCVNHRDLSGWADRIEVSAGRNARCLPYETITATRFSSLDAWVERADRDFDIGAIHLDESLGDEVGHFGYASLPPSELDDYSVNIAGYPLRPGGGTKMYFHHNSVLGVTERRMFYDVDTTRGQSGAPVWIHENAGDPPIVVGIHAYGTRGTPRDLDINANSAPRIIPEVFERIQEWVKQDDPNG